MGCSHLWFLGLQSSVSLEAQQPTWENWTGLCAVSTTELTLHSMALAGVHCLKKHWMSLIKLPDRFPCVVYSRMGKRKKRTLEVRGPELCSLHLQFTNPDLSRLPHECILIKKTRFLFSIGMGTKASDYSGIQAPGTQRGAWVMKCLLSYCYVQEAILRTFHFSWNWRSLQWHSHVLCVCYMTEIWSVE